MYTFDQQSLIFYAVLLIGIGLVSGIIIGVVYRGWRLEYLENKLAEYRKSEKAEENFARAWEIAQNSIYGVTSLKFDDGEYTNGGRNYN